MTTETLTPKQSSRNSSGSASTAASTTTASASTGGNSLSDLLGESLAGAEIVNVNRSDFHFLRERNARPSSHPAYSDAAICELADSIEMFSGLLDPLILSGIKAREETGFAQYALISGHRRVMALDLLAARTGNSKWIENIPCRIAKSGSQTAIVRAIQLVENAGRRDLDAGSVAQSLVEIYNSFGGDVSMADVCKIVGASGDKVDVFMKIVELPQAVKDAISSGDIDDKKVFILADAKYEIGDTEWASVLRLSRQLSATGFRSAMDKMFTEQPASNTAPATQKPKGVGVSDLKRYFIPAVTERYSEVAADAESYAELCKLQKKEGELLPPKPDCLAVKFTECDIAARVLDSLRVIAGVHTEGSPLMAIVTPFMEATKAAEDNTKASKKAVSSRDKWIRQQVSLVNKCLRMPMDIVTGKRPFATLADSLTGVVATWGGLSAADANAAGFDLASELGDDNMKQGLAQEVHTKWVETENARRDRIAKAEKKKLDEESAAAKSATAKTAA